jgi:tetratricopeptide (TPR) repeat protein
LCPNLFIACHEGAPIAIGLLIFTSITNAQTDSIEFFQKELEKTQTVEDRIDLLNKLSYEYTQLSLVSAEVLAHEALEKALQINYQQGIATSYNNLGISYSIRGDYGTGLDYFIKALRLRESLQDLPAVSKTFNNIARVFHYQGDLEKAIAYSNRSLELHNQIDDSVDLAMAHISQGDIYLSMTDNASARSVQTRAAQRRRRVSIRA